jgi:hypothetical protein
MADSTTVDARTSLVTDLMETAPERLRALAGLVLLMGVAYALSTDRRRVSWRVVAWGLGLQLLFALLVLRTRSESPSFGR